MNSASVVEPMKVVVWPPSCSSVSPRISAAISAPRSSRRAIVSAWSGSGFSAACRAAEPGLAVGGYLAWNFVHQEPSVPVATTSPADNANAHQKASAFTDAELSSLANEAAQSRGMMVDQISLHATGQGTVLGRAEAHVAGQT